MSIHVHHTGNNQPRPCRGDDNRKPSENANVFCNLAPAVDSTSGGAASCRAGAEGERMEGGRMSHAKSAKSAKGAGGSAGGKNSRGDAETRNAWRTLLHKRTKRKQKGGWSAGEKPTLKTMKTASRTWNAGGKRMCSRGAGVPSARPLKSGKQAKGPCVLCSHAPPGRCDYQSRPNGWSAEGIREGGNPQESLECRFADARGLDTLPVVWRVDGAGWEC